MRRIVVAFVALLAASVPVGCSGADAQRAQELLQQSDAALQNVESFRFAGRMWMQGPNGEEMSLVMRGAASQKGAGASHVTMRADGIPGFPEIGVVARAQRVWMSTGGAWSELPAPAASVSAADQLAFARYVKDVVVEDGPLVEGEPSVKIVGVLDTAAFAEGMLGQLGGVTGSESALLPDFSDVFEDTRMVLYLSETSHLPLRALVDMAMEVEGERLEMHMDFAFTGYGKPVQIPRPA